MAHSDEMDDGHFRFLEDSINGLLAVLFMLDLSMLFSAEQAYKHDCDFRRRADQRSAMLDDCAHLAAKEIRRQSLWIIVGAIFVNSGVFLLMFSPLVLICISAGKGISETKIQIRKFASLSERDYRKIALQEAWTASLI